MLQNGLVIFVDRYSAVFTGKVLKIFKSSIDVIFLLKKRTENLMMSRNEGGVTAHLICVASSELTPCFVGFVSNDEEILQDYFTCKCPVKCVEFD